MLFKNKTILQKQRNKSAEAQLRLLVSEIQDS